MGLKGFRLWAMGQLDSTCRAPPRCPPTLPCPSDMSRESDPPRSSFSLLQRYKLHSKAQVFWKPVFPFIGSRVEETTRRFQAMGKLN
jgi:hypothetical protein